MFCVVELSRLDEDERRDAIEKPVESAKCPVNFTTQSVELIAQLSGGYPYFIQFICREVYDIWIQRISHSISDGDACSPRSRGRPERARGALNGLYLPETA